MTADIAAQRATSGLLLTRGGRLSWRNDAAVALVEPYGGTWEAHGPLGQLGEVRVGSRGATVRWASPTGGIRWWHVTSSLVVASDPELLYEVTDETDSYDADAAKVGPPHAQWRLERLEAMAGMGSWVWRIDENRVEWSETLLGLFGFEPGTELDYETYLGLVHADDVALIESTLTKALAGLEAFTYTHRMFLADRTTERIFECYGEVFADAAGNPTRVFGTARDITEQHRDRTELEYLAEHDPLTDIANRRRITGWLAEYAADARGAVLLLIDIDNFKDINDLRGHAVGDRVIRRIARAIAARIGPHALLGRLGGDEFAVVLPGGDAAEGVELAERLCDGVAVGSIVEEAPGLRITVSIRVSPVAPGQHAEVSLAQADLALYEAKRSGRNCACLFSLDQYHAAAKRVSLLHRVGAALDTGTMALDAQPILDLTTGRATRYELLIRLRDGLAPALSPAEFLPAAERTDLVLRLDRWVVQRAVDALATSQARYAALRFEINVSARSLEDDDFGRWILEVLKEAEVEPQRLGLEITETTAIGNVAAARGLADRLTEAGCGFTLDDFGAGFGSFAHLKNLPFTAVKIAGEFVRHLDDDPVDRALVAAVVGVAGELGMRTVAEHVDRAALIAELTRLGVDDAQGFHLGAPRPLEELLAEVAPPSRLAVG